jgi:hypothetical protein
VKRTLSACTLGVFLAVGLAAPVVAGGCSITATPQTVALGGTFHVTGTGWAPDTHIILTVGGVESPTGGVHSTDGNLPEQGPFTAGAQGEVVISAEGGGCLAEGAVTVQAAPAQPSAPASGSGAIPDVAMAPPGATPRLDATIAAVGGLLVLMAMTLRRRSFDR